MKHHRKLNALVSISLVLSAVGSNLVIPAAAQTSDVQAAITDDSIVLENSSISRTLSIQDGIVRTSRIDNRKTGTAIVPQDGSEDFAIHTILTRTDVPDEEDRIENPQEFAYSEALDRSEWSAVLTNGSGTAFNDSSVALLFDGDLDTYPDEYTKSGGPFVLQIDLGAEQTLSGMSVNKRPGYQDPVYGINGTMGGYEIYVSNDPDEWTDPVCTGEFTEEDYNLHEENGLYNVGDMVYVNFSQSVSGRYVRIVQTSCALGQKEEFSSSEINLYESPVTKTQIIKEPVQVLDRSRWTGTITNGNGTAFNSDSFALLTDGDLNTYPDEYNKAGFPITVEIDMKEEQTVSSFSVNKRPGYTSAQWGINGTMGQYEVYASSDQETWTFAGSGTFTREAYNLHQEGGLYNVGDTVYANLETPVSARYIRIVQLSDALGSTQEFSSSELNLYSDTYQGPDWRTARSQTSENTITPDDLVFEKAQAEDTETGKKVTISFEDYELEGNTWSIDEVFVLDDGSDYMRSFLEISVSDWDGPVIDYIDQDAFVIPDEDLETLWSHPDVSDISVTMTPATNLTLGQPIYVDGFYMGCEFPAADTQAVDNTLHIRYYSGKNFSKFLEDNQLTTDGKFVSWQNVVGAARGVSQAEVQSDFFEYIEDIATPTDFRKQYNSWYDNMMTITDESIEKSFTGVEDALSANGVEPLDSYVVDDGWNNYYDGTYLTTPGSTQGITPNQTGFWEINAKFPNEFYTSAALSNKLTSTFGIWIGPQGGYNYYGSFARMMEDAGTGYAQTNNGTRICTGSRKYIENFKNLAIDYQNRFGVEYWKWDGFALNACTDESHDHMTGGTNNMYFTTDMWEAWTDLFEAVREANAANGKELFINATCYINLSPWLLQWVNTVWLQDSLDTGTQGTGERHQQKMYYRDQVYYRLFVQNSVQFPMTNLYNHDPIYGVSDNSSASDEVWREYLIDNAMKGTAFWELYFSPSIMNDEKYEITADILDFAQSNHEVLKNSKMHGNSPSQGVYGYSAWNEDMGIVSFTNPLSTAQSYDLVIDAQTGAQEQYVQNLCAIQAEPYEAGVLDGTYSYGDVIHVELEAHETKVFVFSKGNTSAPSIEQAYTSEDGTLIIKFDQRIWPEAVKVNGLEAQAALHEDYRTVEISAEVPWASEATVDLSLMDAWGNEYSLSVPISISSQGILADASLTLSDASWSYDAASDTLWLENPGCLNLETGNNFELPGVFSITTGVQTESAGVSLISLNDQMELVIDEDGYAVFRIGNKSLSSAQETTTVLEKAHGTFGTDEYVPTSTQTVLEGKVNDGEAHTITVKRDASGLIKLYVDGSICSSLWDDEAGSAVLSGSSFEIGDDSFEGLLANPVVYSYALTLEEIPAITQNQDDQIILDRSTWTASACSEESAATGDSNAMAAIDGNLASWWHSRYNSPKDTDAMGEHWIAIDFHQEETFDTFLYTGRGSTINGSIKDFRLELLDENGDVAETFTGSFSGLTEAEAFRFDETKTAWGIRLIPLSTCNGNNYAAAIEIELAVDAESMDANSLEAAKASLLKKAEGFDPDQYSDITARPVQSLITKIRALESVSEYTWNKLSQKFEEAWQNLIDVQVLNELIEKAEALEVSSGELEDALYQAKAVKSNALSDEEVQAAVQNLQAVLESLEPEKPAPANKQLLEQAVQYASGLDEEQLKDVNEIVLKEFREALDEAKEILADVQADQDQVDASWRRLVRAIQMLSFTSNKEELNLLIEQAESLNLDDYEEEGKEEFQKALENAKETAADPTALDERIAQAVIDLQKAMDGLKRKQEEEKLDTSLLEYLVSVTGKADLTLYIPSSAASFEAALEKARTVLENPQSQNEIDQAALSLNKAWLDLRLKPDEELLKKLASFLETVDAMNLDALDSASRSRVLSIYKATREALDNDNLSMDEALDLISLQEQILSELNSSDISETVTPAEKAGSLDTSAEKTAAKTESLEVPADNTASKISSESQDSEQSIQSSSQSVKTSAWMNAAFFAILAVCAAALLILFKRKQSE